MHCNYNLDYVYFGEEVKVQDDYAKIDFCYYIHLVHLHWYI